MTVITFCILFVAPIYSQRTLINLISWEEFDIPSGKGALLDSIMANPLYDSIWPVDVDYLPDFQSHGLLQFEIPRITGTINAFAEQVHYYDVGNFVWRGQFTNKDGDMMMIEDGEDNVYGYFFIDSSAYELMDLGGHSNILVKFSDIFSDTTVADCAVDDTDFESINNPSGEEISSRDGCPDTKSIRILVFYSEAAAKVILPGQKANIFVDQLNMALENCGIAMDEVHFELAGVQPLPGTFTESLNIGFDLNELRHITEAGVSPSFEDLRIAPGADLVVLLTNGNYDRCRTMGFSFQDPTGNAEDGFAIVEGDGGIRYSFAHEVGHNLGCGHDDNIKPPSWARGYFWFNHKKRATIMVTGGSGKSHRILYYSSPLVEFDGHVTGFADSRDNVRELRAANNGVADNFCFDATMIAWISGPVKGNESTQYIWCANTLNCDDVDNYHWEISTDGITFSNYANNSTTDCISLYLPSGYDLFIRLTVTCSNDEEYTNFINVFNTDNENHSPVINQSNDMPLFEGEIFGDVTVYPNPANNNIEFEFILKEATHVQLLRTSTLGVSEVVFEGYLESGKHKLMDSNASNLIGPYYYTIASDKAKESKIVIYK
ncbi:MAG: M12 family metallo-peptidase, partial [Nitrososphaerales archaeon]